MIVNDTSESQEGSPLVEGSAPGGVPGELTFLSTVLLGEITDEADEALLSNEILLVLLSGLSISIKEFNITTVFTYLSHMCIPNKHGCPHSEIIRNLRL